MDVTPVTPVQIANTRIGGGELTWIAGPCVLEDPDRVLRIAMGIDRVFAALEIPWIFKASFDKANRTRRDSPRGPGLSAGLELIGAVRDAVGVPVTTDVHLPAQAEAVAEVVDLLQIPAFLCRQTDLLTACGRTGRPVNLKRGQFVDPRAMGHAVDKLDAAGAGGVILTERGTTFGHGDLVVDLRSLVWMRRLGVPVIIDATHSAQQPSGGVTGGDPSMTPAFVLGGIGAGVDGVFTEVHDAPAEALSDAATQLALADLSVLAARGADLYRGRRVRAAVVVRGRVQGVSFRAYTQRSAHDRGIAGWVRNRSDGAVEARFEGPARQVDAMIRWCHGGSPRAEVASVDVDWVPIDGDPTPLEIRADSEICST